MNTLASIAPLVAWAGFAEVDRQNESAVQKSNKLPPSDEKREDVNTDKPAVMPEWLKMELRQSVSAAAYISIALIKQNLGHDAALGWRSKKPAWMDEVFERAIDRRWANASARPGQEIAQYPLSDLVILSVPALRKLPKKHQQQWAIWWKSLMEQDGKWCWEEAHSWLILWQELDEMLDEGNGVGKQRTQEEGWSVKRAETFFALLLANAKTLPYIQAHWKARASTYLVSNKIMSSLGKEDQPPSPMDAYWAYVWMKTVNSVGSFRYKMGLKLVLKSTPVQSREHQIALLLMNALMSKRWG